MKQPDEETLDREPEDEFGAEGAAKAKIKKLREELTKAKADRQEFLDGWQRCKADSINLRKDLEAQARRSGELLREALVHDIIPALDSFDMAAASEAWATVGDGWKSGMEYVRDQLIAALKTHGVERYGKVGEQIDHTRYEIVEERDDAPGDPGTVARILRYGYKTDTRVLRPAQVIAKK